MSWYERRVYHKRLGRPVAVKHHLAAVRRNGHRPPRKTWVSGSIRRVSYNRPMELYPDNIHRNLTEVSLGGGNAMLIYTRSEGGKFVTYTKQAREGHDWGSWSEVESGLKRVGETKSLDAAIAYHEALKSSVMSGKPRIERTKPKVEYTTTKKLAPLPIMRMNDVFANASRGEYPPLLRSGKAATEPTVDFATDLGILNPHDYVQRDLGTLTNIRNRMLQGENPELCQRILNHYGVRLGTPKPKETDLKSFATTAIHTTKQKRPHIPKPEPSKKTKVGTPISSTTLKPEGGAATWSVLVGEEFHEVPITEAPKRPKFVEMAFANTTVKKKPSTEKKRHYSPPPKDLREAVKKRSYTPKKPVVVEEQKKRPPTIEEMREKAAIEKQRQQALIEQRRKERESRTEVLNAQRELQREVADYSPEELREVARILKQKKG